MRVLITGADGFVGCFTVAECEKAGHDTIEFEGDLRDASHVRQFVADTTLDACIHLAGIAFVPACWDDPKQAFDVNTVGTITLLEALRASAPDAQVVIASSSEVYGREPKTEAIRETDALAPSNPYGISKAAADAFGLVFARKHGLHVMTGRPQNHIGPEQDPRFVVASFAQQLVDIREGRQEPVMRVGNLASTRCFLDVRDVARAYRLLIEGGDAGEAYNIASGDLEEIQKVLDLLCEIVGVQPEVQVDPDRFRPADTQPLLSTEKIEAAVGWRPERSLRGTLEDIVASL